MVEQAIGKRNKGTLQHRRDIYHPLKEDGPVQYEEIQARSILNRVKAMMPMSWTINPYRGCRHACVYCYARPTHTYYGLNAGSDFHTRIFVKVNAPDLLRKELSRPSWKGEAICLGSATDPYQPAEKRYHLVRNLLEVLCEYANPLDIITKSNLVVDDLDLLVELNRRTGGRVAVNMSLTTIDAQKARLIDPGAPSPQKRLEAIARLSAAGIKTRLFIMPVLPGITDDPEELEKLVKAGAEAGAHRVSADTIRIARGLEDYYFSFIEANFPELFPRYMRLFERGRRTMVSEAYKEALRKKMAELRARYKVEDNGDRRSISVEDQRRLAQLNQVYDQPGKFQAALDIAESGLEFRGSSKRSLSEPAANLPLIVRPATPQDLRQTSFNLFE
ncbi:MAG TPA: radical SAM protein [Chloroflexia bacterium]|nr:radical SAM protein [Chloroflexia bacterium]